MVDFQCQEYSDGKVVASESTRKLIIKVGIRKAARGTAIHSDTITLIARGDRVKPRTLAAVLRFVAGIDVIPDSPQRK
jgi:hypothetical protein